VVCLSRGRFLLSSPSDDNLVINQSNILLTALFQHSTALTMVSENMKIVILCLSLLLVAQVGAQSWETDGPCRYVSGSSKFRSWTYSGKALAKINNIYEESDCCEKCLATVGCKKFTQWRSKFGSSTCTLFPASSKIKYTSSSSSIIIIAGEVL
jgi:hypothetical protein